MELGQLPGGTTVSPGASVGATMTVPLGTKPGMYQGAVVLNKAGAKSIVVPTTVAVGATATQDATTKEITGSTVFGGPGQSTADELYDNGSVFGASDWTWRAESGDWRFFFLDVPETPPAGHCSSQARPGTTRRPYTDIDTLVFGRSANSFQLLRHRPVPHLRRRTSSRLIGGSPNTNQGAGVWGFDTATGGNSDLVAARAQAGLHEIALHQVGFDGGKFNVPVQTTVAGAYGQPEHGDSAHRDRNGRASTSRSRPASTYPASTPRRSV